VKFEITTYIDGEYRVIDTLEGETVEMALWMKYPPEFFHLAKFTSVSYGPWHFEDFLNTQHMLVLDPEKAEDMVGGLEWTVAYVRTVS
jgi:hypothetical protein